MDDIKKRIESELKAYKFITSDIRESRQHIKDFKGLIESKRDIKAITYSQTGTSAKGLKTSPVESKVLEIERETEKLKEWNKRVERLHKREHAILYMLDALEDHKRDVVIKRAINRQPWQKVLDTGYSKTYVQKLYSLALDGLSQDEKVRSYIMQK